MDNTKKKKGKIPGLPAQLLSLVEYSDSSSEEDESFSSSPHDDVISDEAMATDEQNEVADQKNPEYLILDILSDVLDKVVGLNFKQPQQKSQVNSSSGKNLSMKYLNIEATRQVSSLIHSARPMVTPVANIVFCCFVFLDLKSGGGWTDGQHAKTMIPSGRDFGLAEWINTT